MCHVITAVVYKAEWRWWIVYGALFSGRWLVKLQGFFLSFLIFRSSVKNSVCFKAALRADIDLIPEQPSPAQPSPDLTCCKFPPLLKTTFLSLTVQWPLDPFTFRPCLKCGLQNTLYNCESKVKSEPAGGNVFGSFCKPEKAELNIFCNSFFEGFHFFLLLPSLLGS